MYCTILDKTKQNCAFFFKSNDGNVFAKVDVYFNGTTYNLFIRPKDGGIYDVSSANSEKEVYIKAYECILRVLKREVENTETELRHLKTLTHFPDQSTSNISLDKKDPIM